MSRNSDSLHILRLLVVSGSQDDIEGIQAALKQHGISTRIHAPTTAAEVMSTIHSGIDLIIADPHYPLVSFLDLTKEAHKVSFRKIRRTTTWIFSGYSGISNIQRCFRIRGMACTRRLRSPDSWSNPEIRTADPSVLGPCPGAKSRRVCDASTRGGRNTVQRTDRFFSRCDCIFARRTACKSERGLHGTLQGRNS